MPLQKVYAYTELTYI